MKKGTKKEDQIQGDNLSTILVHIKFKSHFTGLLELEILTGM